MLCLSTSGGWRGFRNAPSIAFAPEDEVLRYWEGLGYYARAKNIQKAARIIVSEFEGKIPRDFDSVRKLPGVGRYTAGAIMSVAFNADYPAADANAARVFARIFDISHPSGSKEFQEAVWRHASEALPEGRSRDFNQALMDLGSMVCLGREPVCAKCPISRCCGAFRAGTVGERPVKSVKKPATPLVKSVGVWLRDGKVLVRKRPGAGLMPNLWEFPGGGARDGEGPEDALRRVWLEELGVRLGTLRGLAVIKHSHYIFRVTLHAFLVPRRGRFTNSFRKTATGPAGLSPATWKTSLFRRPHRKVKRALAQRLRRTVDGVTRRFFRGQTVIPLTEGGVVVGRLSSLPSRDDTPGMRL